MGPSNRFAIARGSEAVAVLRDAVQDDERLVRVRAGWALEQSADGDETSGTGRIRGDLRRVLGDYS